MKNRAGCLFFVYHGPQTNKRPYKCAKVINLRNIIAKLDASAIVHKKRLKLLLSAASLLALAYAGLCWLVFNNYLVDFDAQAEEAIGSWSFKGLHTYFDFTTDSRTIILTTMLVVGLFYFRKQFGLAGFVILAWQPATTGP